MFRLSRVFCNGSNLTNYLKNSSRTLYTLNSLGLNSYIEKREKVKQFFVRDGDSFREKMKEFVANDGTSMIFTEDLKNMCHLTGPNEEDVQLLEGMVRKFHQQNKETRFGNFIFGPVIMRCLHHINKPDVALKWFKDPELDGFFDQLVTYQILCDMLYEHGRYQDVIDVYEAIRSKQIQGGTNPRYVVTLVFAACYKENTPESFKYASNLFMELSNIGHIPIRRAITFAAALALKQNAPHVALEIIGTVRQQNYVTVRNIKAEAFSNLGRADDAVAILRGVLQLQDTPNRHSFTKDAINTVKEAVNKTADNELIQNFDRLEKYLIENGQVDDKTLEDIITAEIETKSTENSWDKNSLAASYNNNNRDNRRDNRSQIYRFQRAEYGGRGARTGLTDMD
ncbi:pentatricopeptide repeat-containing protein 2, mitochondrial-like [Bradysia coprophila]|uniref:pentatricopeptide repeat-containing protein 2, mitochondrial-like n=1 Tax=Bradysia coprophila TaxID=38358 RepID=UPI00187DC65E|nr:pentatricopeptide repeat-containing protein 2, mitochondrial-like [Bradysia coprophila]